MTKLARSVAFWMGFTLATCAAAQQTLPAADAQAAWNAERARIEAKRAQVEALSTNESAACYQNFFVNNCLDEVKAKQQGALAELRRDEVRLNEVERKARATEQLQKIEDKRSPEARAASAERRAGALKEAEARALQARQKIQSQADRPLQAQTSRESAAKKAQANQQDADARALRRTQDADNLRKYQERLEKAKANREQAQREQLSRGNTPVKPLPVPN